MEHCRSPILSILLLPHLVGVGLDPLILPSMPLSISLVVSLSSCFCAALGVISSDPCFSSLVLYSALSNPLLGTPRELSFQQRSFLNFYKALFGSFPKCACSFSKHPILSLRFFFFFIFLITLSIAVLKSLSKQVVTLLY